MARFVMRFTRPIPMLLAALALGGVPHPVQAQVVHGQVLDAATGEPLATVRVSLVTEDDDHVATVLTGAGGRFTLRAEAPGPHRLEADRLGYGLQHDELFEVPAEGVVERDFPLTSRAVEVEGIVVEGYPGQLLHQDNLAGVYARRARSPSVGGNRVLVRGDRQLDESLTVRDVLPHGFPGLRCPRDHPVIFRDGRRVHPDRGRRYIDESRDLLEPDPFIKEVLDLPVSYLEGIEFYRDYTAIPMPMRPLENMPGEPDFRYVRYCGVVLVWTEGAPR